MIRASTSVPDFTLYGMTFRSRLMLGTSQYPAILAEAARASLPRSSQCRSGASWRG